MLGIPVITNSDSIYDMKFNQDISDGDRLAIVNHPLIKGECFKTIRDLEERTIDINSSRRWIDYCNPQRWCKDIMGQ